MKNALRQIVKGIMDTYISFECAIIRFSYRTSGRLESREEKIRKGKMRKRVLILRKDVIGDFILFIPTLKYYREYFKDANISLVVNTVVLDLIPQFDFIDHVIPYDGKKFRSNFFYRRQFFHYLAKAGFETVVHAVYSREYVCDRMVRATGAEATVAFRASRGPMSTDKDYTRIIETPANLNEPARNAYFAKAVTGLEAEVHFPSLDINKFDHTQADAVLKEIGVEDNNYIVMLPGAGAFYRTWQLEKFAEVANYITEKYKLKVLLSGAPSDAPLNKKIAELAATKNPENKNIKAEGTHKDTIIDITGKTNIPNFAHILNRSKFYFGSETGPMHLATAIGKPVIVVLGGGHFGRFFPYGDPKTNRYIADKNATCRGDDWKCSNHLKPGEIAPCIRNIKVEDAIKEIDMLLAIID